MRRHGKRALLARLLCDEALAVRGSDRPRTLLTFKAANRSYRWTSDTSRSLALR